jgi:hypothetical protein
MDAISSFLKRNQCLAETRPFNGVFSIILHFPEVLLIFQLLFVFSKSDKKNKVKEAKNLIKMVECWTETAENAQQRAVAVPGCSVKARFSILKAISN